MNLRNQAQRLLATRHLSLLRLGFTGALALLLSHGAPAQTLRWALAGDAESMDPHVVAEMLTMNVNQLVYEGLVEFDAAHRLVPALAQRWSTPEPTRWRFELRAGVRFHDGTPLDADDVVFSILRARQPSSPFSTTAGQLGQPVRIDARTLELRLAAPNPLLLDYLSNILVMSRRWAEGHGSARVPDFKSREEAVSSRQAMGTGRFRLVSREPGVRTVFERYPGHWGTREGNVERVEMLPIANGATRVAALVSGAVDLVQDVPIQDIERIGHDPSLRLSEGVENRVFYLGLDLSRDELRYGSVKDRNPLKDPRVRAAMALALDTTTMQRTLLHGRGEATRCLAMTRGACLAPELETPLRPNLERARELLAEAGLPDGFSLTLDCANDRYAAGMAICNAIATQLARIGVRVQVDARSKSIVFPKLFRGDTSAYLFSIGAGMTDSQLALDFVVHRPDPATGKGTLNFGRIGSVELDQRIDALAVDTDPVRRAAAMRAVQQQIADELLLLPLLRPPLTLAMRAGVRATVTPSNAVRPDWIRIEQPPR